MNYKCLITFFKIIKKYLKNDLCAKMAINIKINDKGGILNE